MDSHFRPIAGLNPALLTIASRVADNRAQLLFDKVAIVPSSAMGGGDPSQGGGGAPQGAPPPDPSMAAGGGAAAPADPSGGGGDQVSQVAQQVMQMMQAQGGGAGPGGKGKSPKDQIQQGQMKILMHLVAQMASKQGIQVDPQLLVPATDPGTDQMAMQEVQNSSMAPSGDPNAPQGAAAGGGAQAQGPPPVPPMDPSQGPIGKAASFPELDTMFDVGRPYPTNYGAPSAMPDFDAIINGTRSTQSLAARTRQALGV